MVTQGQLITQSQTLAANHASLGQGQNKCSLLIVPWEVLNEFQIREESLCKYFQKLLET
jgi:hypothetical protein